MSQSNSQSQLETGVADEEEKSNDQTDEDQASLFDVGGGENSTPEQGEQPDPQAETGPNSGTNAESDREKENLEEFGVEEDHSPNTPRLDNPDGELKEDRRTNRRSGEDTTEQEQLFPDIDDPNQITLGGERAYNQCKFG
jgi:hypothetical protein